MDNFKELNLDTLEEIVGGRGYQDMWTQEERDQYMALIKDIERIGGLYNAEQASYEEVKAAMDAALAFSNEMRIKYGY